MDDSVLGGPSNCTVHPPQQLYSPLSTAEVKAHAMFTVLSRPMGAVAFNPEGNCPSNGLYLKASPV
jgi:hypothetical protein